MSLGPFTLLSAWNNSIPTGPISVKIDIGNFDKNLSILSNLVKIGSK
jgi:hypothetical protein